ncbi:MAG: oligopeptide transporter, OPT family, partial [Halobacteriales archaeon]|nr:oligopeptide transporter, OPT family [Halobacteriales archaeon]
MASPQRQEPSDAQLPYIPAYLTIAEVTVKGVILGLVLAVLLGAANTYLGLKAGLTVSASIPAAVISLGVLRLFRNSTVLENNMVQTIASAGEAVAGGILFTIPALLIVGYWTKVGYWETTVVGVVGGILGVLFTVPLRRALIVEENLAFPEGVATAEVLKSGDKGGGGVGTLVAGGLVGAVFKFVESGLKMFQENALFTQQLGGRVVYGLGSALSPALMGVGAIVGLRVASLVFAGGAFAWLVAMPLYTGTHPDLGTLRSALLDNTALGVWKFQVRYLGVGAMLVGGIWSLIKLRKPLGRAMGQGLRSRSAGKATEAPVRTEVELSARTTFIGVAVLLVPMFLFYAYISRDVRAPAGVWSPWVVALVMSLLMV